MKPIHMIPIAAFAVAGALAVGAVAQPASVQVVNTSIGDVLADGNGMTLYIWDNDAVGVSNCAGNCATNWPPFYSEPGAVAGGDYTLVRREEGSTMWAYKGMPLYLWVRDTAPGQVSGDGVGSTWHAARP